MKVLYIGQLNQGGTCLARAHALESYGWEIVPFDTLPYLNNGGRIRRGLQHRLNFGPDVFRLNKDILNRCQFSENFDAIWFDKARWVFPETLHALKIKTNSILAHYTPDPAFTFHSSRHFANGVSEYDVCITTKDYEIASYQQNRATKVVFNWQGIDTRFTEQEECKNINTPNREGVVFIGHREPYYEEILTSVGKTNLSLSIWGNGWPDARRKNSILQKHIKGAGVWGKDYPKTLASAKIGIGLLSKYCPDNFTTRTFEIPASGAMLLAERTKSHSEIFCEGVEAEFFSTTDELNEKLAFYLNHDRSRIQIAEKGRQRVLNDFTWRTVLSPTIEAIVQAKNFKPR